MPPSEPYYSGSSSKRWTIISVIASILFVGAAVFGVWAFLNYREQKSDVDAKIDIAVAEARKDQVDIDEAKFTERENAPDREFVGPDDYGQVSFMYPKSWSAYVHKDANRGGNYEVYFHPVVVPPVTVTERFALRVVIEEKDYDAVLATYDSLVKKGDLTSSSISANDHTGTRLDGDFTKDIRGSAALFKIRDKTLTVRTDANTFKEYFDALIQTISFKQ